MEAVSIGTDGVRTHLTLLHQTLGKEALQQCRQADGVFMADPPSAAAAIASPRALARESPPDTTACRRGEHGPGRWTTEAVVFRSRPPAPPPAACLGDHADSPAGMRREYAMVEHCDY